MLVVALGAVFIHIGTQSTAYATTQVNPSATPNSAATSPVAKTSDPITFITILNSGSGVYGNILSQQTVTVVIGVNNTVVWTNQNSGVESIISADGLFNSGILAPGQSFTYTFNQNGTYAYYGSGYHSLLGVVVVESS